MYESYLDKYGSVVGFVSGVILRFRCVGCLLIILCYVVNENVLKVLILNFFDVFLA